ncbi:hypothetical protein BpHYR1_044866 [Brachionus plicatilis]|uniref:Uncharacterized protein n=1 Tax=Brachionus plicatilis TaxID=10195 RepID=A0A3M7R0W5_BRAPC|nr:hypothetical protein BpHYR1_044866 [Brachionus plicatilis]
MTSGRIIRAFSNHLYQIGLFTSIKRYKRLFLSTRCSEEIVYFFRDFKLLEYVEILSLDFVTKFRSINFNCCIIF